MNAESESESEPEPDPSRARAAGATRRVLGFADRHRRWLAPLLLLWFACFCNGRWRPEGDGAVALSVGRSIARGAGFAHPDGLDGPLSPGLPWLAAAGFRLLGSDSVLVPLLFVAACWFAGLGLCFALVRRAAGRPTAVVVTALLGVSESWVSYGVAVGSDLPFATGTLAVLLGCEWLAGPARDARPRRPLGGAALAAAGLLLCAAFRSVWVVVAAASVLAALLGLARTGRWRALAAAALTAPAVAAAAWALSAAVRDDAAVLLGHLTSDPGGWARASLAGRLPRLVTESLPEAVFALDVGPVATAIAFGLLLAGLVLASTRPLRPLWLLLPGLLAAQWIAYEVHDRYALPVLPLLLLGWWTLAARLDAAGHRGRFRWFQAPLRLAVPGALVAAIGMNVAALVEVFEEQRSAKPLSVYADGELEPVADAAAWLRANTLPDAVVLAGNEHATTLAFLADRRVLSGRELEKLGPDAVPARWVAAEPLDGRARRAAEAAGLMPGETLWRSGHEPAASLRVMMRR